MSEVGIDSIAAGGAGVGHLADGRVVFVQRTAPGDRALIEITHEKKRWAQGRLLRVIEPGPGRREAPCPHYARCGGCTIEHLHYDHQLAAKRGIVQAALQRIGGIHVPPFEMVASPREFRYRNRVSFTLFRTLTGRIFAGFHELERPDWILDITGACMLPEEPIAVAWDALRAGWGNQASLLPSGERLRLTLRGTATGRVTLVIDGGFSHGQPERLLEAVPVIAAIWQRREGDREHVLRAGDANIADLWQEEDVELSGSVFLQVNREAAQLLEDYVFELASAPAGKRVIDAYCGIGLHSRRLSRQGFEVVGIELDIAAIAEARRAEPGAEFIAGPVEFVLPTVLPADLVILNPPRAGLAHEAATALSGTPPARIIYISCDPATLARDLARLATTHSLVSLRCFDLFPQTAHVETVAELKCDISSR